MIGIIIMRRKYDGKKRLGLVGDSIHIFRFGSFPMTQFLPKSKMHKKVKKQVQSLSLTSR